MLTGEMPFDKVNDDKYANLMKHTIEVIGV
jgi:hypothetical protein